MMLRDPIHYYEPTTHPGAFLPHAWVEHAGQRISTLDIVGHGQFGLVVGIGGGPWVPAAATVSKKTGVELPLYAVGYCCPYNDVLGDWRAQREVGDRGALLVRPDRHIAWCHADRPTDPTEVLHSALRHILAHDMVKSPQ